ncbi:MAG: DUF5518 domain-containing protein [Acidobacteria bacterium]|nr:DUF5518 domain-containing protein [Acidobacteriota bacterium]
MRKLQPALLGGAFMGVLSSLPFISAGNCCCCLWVIGGGVLAAYLLQQNEREPISVGDGARVGLLAGVFGAIIGVLLSIPLEMMTGPIQQRMLERILENSSDLPPGWRDMLERSTFEGGRLLARVIGAVVWTIAGMIFGMLGGVLGAAIFKRNPPPPPAGTVEVLPPEV